MNQTHLHRRRPRSERAPEIGARIREKRDLLGLTTRELGEAAGLTHGAITQYETGRASPKKERLEGLAQALGTSIEWLLTGHDPEILASAQNKLELDLLALIRKIPTDQRPIVLAAMKGIAEAAAKKT
ncbi:hypothetical protein GLI01_23740 [Gluconacetobacter liquefaciens]|uniref:Helix-turn-helix protein n=1 Tax=Gluconacetobacter liquefaciens TaxID=89584 RepID=A0A370G6I7_GLULI|nr:helix-turn-helix transcriptional regulator [Gluconacetobacter liquefaciens]MBB2186460.1 helix-turn-helix transcriptional regulator [Gluconacetobacter liquefaciens]RDI38124.1 helix-turn-helix protein [Gluconacetobacter liquefaciens]GEB38339.1 hypothetical protein GLI01_23740 [Gluconacetobacter liquefaciens]